MPELAILSMVLSLVLTVPPGEQGRPPGEPVRSLAAAALAFPGIADGDATGFAVAAGDLDGDGIGDLVVGAPCHAAGGDGAGAVYVLYGPLEQGRPLGDADATLIGDERGDFVGEAVGVADLDGDGDDELLIGSPGPFVGTGPVVDGCFAAPTQPGTNRPGEAYVLEGGARRSGTHDARATADAVLTGVTPMDFFGMDVAGVGDVDGDGDEDLVVGAHGPGALPAGGGSAYVFTGPVAGDVAATEATTILLGERPADLAGAIVGGADLDGDGRSDLLVSAPGNAVPPALAGRVYLFHDLPPTASSLASADAVLEGESEDDFAGRGLTTGALVGDPLPDVAVGAPGSETVYVVPGRARPAGEVALADAPVRIDGSAGHDFGHALVTAELDGDGPEVLVVGAPAVGVAGEGGTVAVFPRVERSRTAEDAARRYTGAPGENAGFSLAAADVDGDGVEDIVVGAPSLDDGGPGGVHLVTGASVLDARPPDPRARGPEKQRRSLPATGGSGVLGALLASSVWVAARTAWRRLR